MIRKTIILISLLSFSSSEANNLDLAYKEKYSQSVTGGIGLIQTPTARFSKDGEFGFGISSESPYNRLYAKMQFFPWMEAVLRYTEGTFEPYNPGSSQTWKDKGLDVKFRLMEENDIFPELAIGLIDLGGTGAYSSEYFVASKSINNFDFSLGMGWGRLGGVDHLSNILGFLDEGRKRRGGYSSRGGKISLDRFFSGKNTSFFGGAEYFTPVPNLSIKLEYDSSDYSNVEGREKTIYETGDVFEVDSRFNYALNYALDIGQRDRVDFSLGFVRGNTIYANLTVHSNLNFSGTPRVILGAEKIRNTNLPGGDTFSGLSQRLQKFLTDRTIREMGNIGFVTHRIIYNGDELSAEISQSRFQDSSQAICDVI